MRKVAAAIGLSMTSLYKWEAGTRCSNVDQFLALETYLDTVELGIVRDDFTIEKRKTHRVSLPFDASRPENPHYDNNVSSGSVLSGTSGPELIVDRILAPSLGNIEGMVEVCSDNMEPTIKKGDRIGIVRLPSIDYAYPGNVYYVVDDNLLCYVLRIATEVTNNELLLLSDNKDKYPPMRLGRQRIIGLFKVVAVIEKY